METSPVLHRGLPVPRTLAESLHAVRPALLVYDAQVGIFSQLPEPAALTARLVQIVEAARAAALPILFSRHLSLPVELMGMAQMRMALAWQRTNDPRQVRPWFLRDSSGIAILPEVSPLPSEAVFDKLTMSAFEGTLLDIALRDLGVQSIILIGAAMEIGIEPTVRHAADLGYIPVVVRDACGAGHPEAAQRALDSLAFAGDTLFTDTDELCELLASLPKRTPAI